MADLGHLVNDCACATDASVVMEVLLATSSGWSAIEADSDGPQIDAVSVDSMTVLSTI
jgi:hypothetical protein